MFTLLTVCTGNICRSPAAEYLLRNALGPTVRVVSAGTPAVDAIAGAVRGCADEDEHDWWTSEAL